MKFYKLSVTIFCLSTCVSFPNLNGQVPNLTKDFNSWVAWITEAGEYDAVFQGNLKNSCCGELNFYAKESLGPSINFLYNERANVDVKVQEMKRYIEQIEVAYKAKNKEQIIKLLKIGLETFSRYQTLAKLGKLKDGAENLQGFMWEEIADGFKQKYGISNENVLEILDNGYSLAIKLGNQDAAAISKKIEKKYRTTTQIFKYGSWFLTGSTIILTVYCPPAALASFLIQQSWDLGGNAIDWSLSREQMNALGDFLSEKETILDNYRTMLMTLTSQQNTLVRQRAFIKNKCGLEKLDSM